MRAYYFVLKSLSTSFLGTLMLILGAFGHSAYPEVRDGRVDTSFWIMANSILSGSRITTIVPLTDGKILVGGDLTTVSGGVSKNIGRLNPDGSFDDSFKGDVNSTVNGIFPLADGKILITGNFLQYGGEARKRIARLHPNGNLDQTFIPDFGSDYAEIVAVQPDGKIIVAFSNSDGVQRSGIVRLNPDASVDPTFDDGTGTDIRAAKAAVQPDGKIIIAGRFSTYDGISRIGIARLNADGSLDSSFASSPFSSVTPEVFDISLTSDGKICLAADYYGSRVYVLAKDGTIDVTFNPGDVYQIGGRVYSVLAQPDGKILAGGEFEGFSIDGVRHTRHRLFRFNADGSVDQTFEAQAGNSMSSGGVRALALYSDNKILLGGDFPQVNGVNRGGIARLNFDSSLDTSFVGFFGSPSFFSSSYVYPDGRILLGGDFAVVNGFFTPNAARLDADGGIDETYVTDASVNARVTSIAVQPDGRIIFGGFANDFFHISKGLWRVHSDGSPDSSFNGWISSSASIQAITLQPDGKILIGGNFTAVNGVSRRAVARLNEDGSLDTSFQPTFGALGVSTIALQPDGRMLVGGSFTSVNGTQAGNIVRLNADGTVDSSFDTGTGANNSVNSISIRDDGSLYVAGSFSRFSDEPRSSIVRLHPNGAIDTTFRNPRISSFSRTVFSILQLPDNKILLGGMLNSEIDAAPRSGVLRLFENGTIDYSFDVSGVKRDSSTGAIFNLDVQPDGGIIASGQFNSINGRSQWGIARLLNFRDPTRSPFDFDGDGKTDISVFRPGTGAWHVKRSQVSHDFSLSLGNSSDTLVPCDYDGDFLTDYAVYRPSEGNWYIHFVQSNTISTFNHGSPGDIPIPGDFDGDGKCDVGVYTPTNGTWRIAGSKDGPITIQLGEFGDLPVVGDYDGDGVADAAVYRPRTGEWTVLGSVMGETTVSFGSVTDWVVPADYDGDGITDMAVFRPLEAVWHISYSKDGSQNLLTWGLSTDIPIPGDYDGDGSADLAVYRPSDGSWIVDLSSGGSIQHVFGEKGDIAIPGAFVRQGNMATISGRVTTPNGLGLRNAVVSIVDSRNVRSSVITSPLGYYSFTDVVGASYQISVTSKRYRFASRTIQVTDDLTEVDFVGIE